MEVRKALAHHANKAERKDTEAVIHQEASIAVLNKAEEDQDFLEKLMAFGSESLKEYERHLKEEAALISGDIGWIEAHIGKLDDRLRIDLPRL